MSAGAMMCRVPHSTVALDRDARVVSRRQYAVIPAVDGFIEKVIGFN